MEHWASAPWTKKQGTQVPVDELGAGGVMRPRDRVGAWCGFVMIGAAVLVGPLGWLSQMGMAPLVWVMGLLCLPAIRLTDEDRPVLIVLLGAVVWGAVSTMWSPYHPKTPDRSGALQLALALVFTWSAICGARRADPRLTAYALRVLGWSLTFFSLMILVDVPLNGRLYHGVHVRYYEPMRLDEAQNALAHATTVLAVLWPVALASRLRSKTGLAMAVLAALATALGSHVFRGDAPLYSVVLSIAAIIVVRSWPTGAVRLLAGGVAGVGFAMPAFVWLVRTSGNYVEMERLSPPSWAARMTYWSHAIDWIADRPLRGWGLDASRAMGPGIQLHPHNAALQIWLELGLVGTLSAATFWTLSVLQLSRARKDPVAAAVAGSVVAFVFISWVSYGAWQAWWLSVGSLVPVIAAMLRTGGPSLEPAPAGAARVRSDAGLYDRADGARGTP